MSPKASAKTSTEIAVDPRCKYVAASGRRCRALASRDTTRASGYSAFCLPHAQMEQQFLNAESVAEDLIGPIHDFRTNTVITEILGNLLKLVAQNRIPLRNANALAYICQLLLNSSDGVRHESNLIGGKAYEQRIITDSMDTMWPDDDEEEEADEESDEDEEQEAEQENESENKEQKSAKPNALDAAIKLLSGS